MPQYFSTAADFKDQRLHNFLDTAGSHLHASKEKQVFTTEIRKDRREIEYIEDKIAIARTQVRKAREASKETEIRLQEAEKELSRIRKEREAAEGEYETLKAIEKDLESKRAILPGIKRQIVHVREDISKLSATFEELQSTHRARLVEKEGLEKEMGSLKIRLEGLENEIPVMRNTRDILVGVMPEGFDADTFDAIQDQGKIEKAINDYVTEVNEQIEKLEKEASELNAQIGEKHAQQEPLLSRKEHLTGKVKDFTAEVGGEVEKTTIEDEVNRLRDEKGRLVAESEGMTKETNRLEASIKRLDDELEQGKQLERDLMERYTYLTSRKQKMDEFDDIDAEIERLQKEMQKCDRDSNANDKLIEITDDIKQDVGFNNDKLRSALKDYNEQVDVFVNILHPKTS
jgi:chromosome segregation ATPase